MNNSSDIENIVIREKAENNGLFSYNIEFISDFAFKIQVNILEGIEVKLEISNKYNLEYFALLFTETNNICNVETTFKLIKVTSSFIGKIPKIIHQSYTLNILPRLHKATYTWQLMNNNYKYMYWDDDACCEYINKNFDERIQNAYYSLYAGAYKSDIFRLCVLYEYGGIWADISSKCIYPLDKLLANEINLLIVKDTPSQITNGNIYQAFIAVEPKNEIIKYILDFTVDRVLNFKKYDNLYPWIHNESIAVTGPTIFAIALNNYLKNPSRKIFNDKYIETGVNKILLLEHSIENDIGYIFYNKVKVVRTKYEGFQKDRTTPHYSKLFSQGYIIKKKINITNVKDIKEDSNNLFQIWISENKYGNNYISEKMYHSYTTWEKNPNINHIFLNNDTIIEIIKNDNYFPKLLEAYISVRVFAFKADLIRYYLLYKYGGTYVDIDSYSVNPLNELYDGSDIVLSYDVDKSCISQAFIYTKKPGMKLFEELINNSISNILERNTSHGDTGVTGPKLFGKVADKLFQYIQRGSEFTVDGLKIKIITYCLNLPLPKGPWSKTSYNSSVESNILTTKCRSKSGELVKNVVAFLPRDNLINNNGKIVGNTNMQFSFSSGSGFYLYKNKIYCVSKYTGYNEERHILGGNDFAEMFQKNKVFL
jgi:mannosyltransferase OCH1-like enzyme